MFLCKKHSGDSAVLKNVIFLSKEQGAYAEQKCEALNTRDGIL